MLKTWILPGLALIAIAGLYFITLHRGVPAGTLGKGIAEQTLAPDFSLPDLTDKSSISHPIGARSSFWTSGQRGAIPAERSSLISSNCKTNMAARACRSSAFPWTTARNRYASSTSGSK